MASRAQSFERLNRRGSVGGKDGPNETMLVGVILA
jgi:hypothetical protein